MSGHVDDAVRSRLYRGPLEGVNGSAVREAIATAAAGVPDDPLPNTLHIDGQLALVDDMLHYFDRGSMAHSLELRVPFLDHHLVEYCARIPADLKVRGWTTKYLLRHAARGIVPHAAIDKPKRGFFRDAFNGWFRAQMRGPASDYLLGGQPRYAEFLDRGEVERMVHRHLSGEGRGEVYFLLTILMLEVWLSSFLPSALAPSSNRESIRIPA
jgi:asparagine synthase (glutamine-hydrolysing)